MIQKLKKRFILTSMAVVTLVLLLVLGLAACSKKTTEAPKTESTAAPT